MYRTFSQYDLGEKRAKPMKAVATKACFVFRNSSPMDLTTVNGLYARFNSTILSISSSSGFPQFLVNAKSRIIEASGASIPPGDSVVFCATFAKKSPGTQVEYWWWTVDGERFTARNNSLQPTSDQRIFTSINGGNVRDYIYKSVITQPTGLVLGLPTDTPRVGWLRFMKADRKYFPHTDESRCLDKILTPSGIRQRFRGEVRNPHVKRHNNHLVGELHALKLAVYANDRGVTEPLDETLLGDLLYDDLDNLSDPYNGKTIRQIIALADSALTYCSHFQPSFYAEIDSCINRINTAFGGAYNVISSTPYLIAGTRSITDVPFLHLNPGVARPQTRFVGYDPSDLEPTKFEVQQNYPNPFNPITTIDFSLIEPAIVSLQVYNLLGQEVAVLLDRSELEDGEHSVDFVSGDLPSGVYLYKLTAVGVDGSKELYQSVKRMLLLK